MKKTLLTCCIIAIFNISFSQTIQLTNGGSTTLSGTTGGSPISQYFEYMRFQVVYTAAELNAAGITGPKSITELGWYISTAPANALPSYKIRMANTTATNSATNNTATLTEVYSVASYAPVAGGFNMLTLNGAFVWNGTDNLLVDVCFGAAVYASPYGEVRTYAATTTSGSRRVRCDACGSQCGTNTNTTNTFKPQVSLTFAPPPSCNVPTGLTATGITSSDANVSWGAVAGASGYEYAVTTSAIPPASGTAIAGTSTAVGSLSAATAYYLHVRTNCSGPFSAWSTYSFTTLCTSTTIPYSENFDGVTAPAIPTCIVVENVNGSNTWGNYSTPGAVIIGTPNSMVYAYNSTVAADDWFFLQGVNLTAGTSYRLTFSWKSNPSFPESFEVKYGTGATAASMTTGTLYTNASAASSSVVVETIDFTPGSTGTFFMGFHCTSIADQDFLAIDNISVTLSPSCGAPISPGVSLSSNTAGTASWAASGVGTPTGYEWAITTSATPPVSGTAIAGTSTPFSGLSASTQYYLHVRTDCGGTFSSWTTFAFATLINDNVCGAVNLTLGGPQDCGNTTIATSVGDPALSCSSPNNTVWYKYTPASTGTVIVRTEIPIAAGNPLDGWVGFYTATGTCPSPGLTLTQVGACTEFGQTGAGDIDDITSPVLTGGVTYYIMIDGFSGDFGEYCISLVAPPPPPACTTNLLPVNGATGVVLSPAPTISWNAAATATSYDVYFDTVNPPITNIGNVAGTSTTITGLNYNTTYYWYVAPKNTGGTATGCNTSTTSFTTENPVNCNPLYTTGCTLADSLTYFSLKGASGTAIYNQSGATCNTSPIAYSDYTSTFAAVTLVRGESFGGFMRTGDPNDYATIWIDGNDDGFFGDNERVINNLLVGTTSKLYSLYVPATTPLGTHRLRIRVIYSATTPTTLTHPCNTYTYGETEDYLVNISNVGSIHGVAVGTPGSCMTAGAITIDAASNNNGSSPVFLVDSLNNYVAALYPNGNNFGTITPSYYVHNGSVRQDLAGHYYLDRNISIATTTQPVNPYNLRLFFRNSELNALIAQPGSGVTSIFDLNSTKANASNCLSAFNGGATVIFPTGFGSLSGDRFLDFTGLTSLSSFYFHGSSNVLLPAGLLSFAGQREGSVNKLRWTTTSEQNNRGFDVQRSADGVNYVTIGFVNSLATSGNSSAALNYIFSDNAPVGNKQYYRLRQSDLDGRTKLSNVIIIKGDKPITLAIDGLFPNPANSQVNVLVSAPFRDKVTLTIVDVSGRTVLQKIVAIETGSNTIPIDISQLMNGSYMVKLICNGNCETALGKFVKQ